MKKKTRMISVAGLLVAMMAGLVLADDYRVVEAFKVADGPACMPALTRAANGDILCAFSTNWEPFPWGGVLKLTVSKDGGRSWSDPRLIYQDKDPRVTIQVANGMQALSNGDILLPVTYCLMPKFSPEEQKRTGRIWNGADPAYRREVRFFRSTDNGKTWTMTDPGFQKYLKRWWRFGRLVELDDGRLIMPGKGFYLVSRDFGHTWPERVETGMQASETNICKAPDGTWFTIVRNGEIMPRLFKTNFSYDDGKTWTKWQFAGVRGKMPDVLVTKEGWILLSVGAEGLGDGSESQWYPRRDSFATLFVSVDNGQSWVRDTPFLPVERGSNVIPVDSPVMCPLEDSRVLVVAQAIDRTVKGTSEERFYDHFSLIGNIIEPIRQGRHWPRQAVSRREELLK